MPEDKPIPSSQAQWFAIKTPKDKAAETFLADKCEEVFFPTQTLKTEGKKDRRKAVIPHVLFIKTTAENALDLEQQGRKNPLLSVPFWIYRHPGDNHIQIIPQASIDLLRLLTSDNTSECRIYTGHEFRANQYVRITGGLYQGYEGYIQRVKKNKQVLVKIEGVCMVLLPFIHPDLLLPLPTPTEVQA